MATNSPDRTRTHDVGIVDPNGKFQRHSSNDTLAAGKALSSTIATAVAGAQRTGKPHQIATRDRVTGEVRTVGGPVRPAPGNQIARNR